MSEDMKTLPQAEEQIDRSCQKFLFQSRQKNIEDGLQGDQVLSENSFFGTLNQNSAFDIQYGNNLGESHNQKKIFEKNSSISGNYEEEEADKVENFSNIQADLNNGNLKNTRQKSSFKINADDILEQSVLQKSQTESNNNDNLLNNESSFVSISQGTAIQKGKLNNIGDTEFSNNEFQQKMNKNQNKQGWIPDQVIYGTDKAQIKKMATLAIMNKQKNQSDMQRKSQQNFEKATGIINRLLNNSMNRMMRVRQHVHNFVALLKIRFFSRYGENLTDKDYMVINDLSIFHKGKKKKKVNFFLQQFYKFVKCTSKIPIFMPTDSLRVIWDIFQVVFTYIFLYFYSILMFFAQDKQDSEFIQKFYFYAFFLFIMDVLINFNTAYFDKDLIINKRKQIAKQYIFSTLFITDCTSIIVLATKVIFQSNSIVYNPDHNLLTYGFNILIFLKSNGMSPKRKRFDYVFTLKESQKHVIKLINQLTSVITVAHIAAIGWYFIGIQENVNDYNISWLSKADLSSSSYYQKYIYSIYWAITTMTTVGYGDIAATNYVEALFISINMILFSCVFAYSINNIGFILQEIEKSSKQLNDNITTIQRKNVNISLKSRVRHYLSFLAQEQKDRDKNAEEYILSILSNKLRDEITIEINTKILNHTHIFSSNFSRQTLNKVVFKMKEVLVSPNEVIFNDEQVEDCSIYFIQSGVVEIYQHSIMKQNKVNIIQTLTDNQLFGEISFFTGLSRKASARSVNLSTLYKISREDFIEILKENDEDFERFKMISEQIIFQNQLNLLHIECYTCKQVGHLASKCPRTHQDFDRQFITLKNIFSRFQERSKEEMIRKEKKSLHAKSPLIEKNIDICAQLKENLQDLNTEIYNMFDTEEIIDEEFEEEDEEEEEGSQSSSGSSDSSSSSKSQKSAKSAIKPSKNSYQKKKSSKMYKKEGSKKIHTSQSSEIQDQVSQNHDMSSFNKPISNLKLEKDEQIKSSSKKLTSSSRIQTNEIAESVHSSNIQNDSCNDIHQINGGVIEINKKKKHRDSESLQSNISELQQLQDSSEFEHKKKQHKKKDKSKLVKQQTAGQAQQIHQDGESIQSSIESPSPKKNINSQKQYAYNVNKCSSKSIDESQIHIGNSSNRAIDTSVPILPEQRSQIQQSQYKSANSSKRFFSQHSTKTINLDHNDYRYSIDNYLITLGLNTLVQSRQSLNQPLNNQRLSKKSLGPNSKLSEIPEKLKSKSKNDVMGFDSELSGNSRIENSNRSIKDNKERSNKNLSTLFPITNINHLPTIKEQKENNENGPEEMQSEKQFVERISKLLQNPQFPLFMQQYSTGMSLREMHSINPQFTFDNHFEKMQNFKKFFPQNNFDKVILKLKSKQLEQKRLKKQKITQKVRRQNIMVVQNQTRSSVYCTSGGFLKFVPQEFNPESYKPTYHSYGVSMRKNVVFPINALPSNF